LLLPFWKTAQICATSNHCEALKAAKPMKYTLLL
jgi:hypothetical protein